MYRTLHKQFLETNTIYNGNIIRNAIDTTVNIENPKDLEYKLYLAAINVNTVRATLNGQEMSDVPVTNLKGFVNNAYQGNKNSKYVYGVATIDIDAYNEGEQLVTDVKILISNAYVESDDDSQKSFLIAALQPVEDQKKYIITEVVSRTLFHITEYLNYYTKEYQKFLFN